MHWKSSLHGEYRHSSPLKLFLLSSSLENRRAITSLCYRENKRIIRCVRALCVTLGQKHGSQLFMSFILFFSFAIIESNVKISVALDYIPKRPWKLLHSENSLICIKNKKLNWGVSVPLTKEITWLMLLAQTFQSWKSYMTTKILIQVQLYNGQEHFL